KVGTEKKMDAADVARAGFEAMMRGEAEVITGWGNKLRAAIARLAPSTAMAEAHKKLTAPGSAYQR
ncbi:MAG TPA: hypothetical protein VGK73_10000, partial [Polyangiaceae bacterium]